jgi:hypothetical protein
MANNQKKLKAFVRYDGSGRVVASSLILRKNKPRVGRWFEIPTYDCCNGDSSTTTSTTTVAPTTTTTTTGIPTTTTTTTPTVYDFTGGYGFGSAGEACFAGMTQTFYSSTPYASIGNGSVIYTDSGLTTPVTYAYVALIGLNKVFSCSNGVLSNQSTCN